MIALTEETVRDKEAWKKEEQALWRAYEAGRSRQARNALVLHYGRLVNVIVRRILSVSGGYAEADDLQSYGVIGLIEAIEKFDAQKGVTFETFATYRIRGEVLDFIRRNDWVPRGARRRAFELQAAVGELASQLGRQPTDAEVCQKLGITKDSLVRSRMDMERFSVVSLEEMLYDNLRGGEEGSPEETLQESELLALLTRTLEELPERERLVITLYYHEELTLKEISRVLDVTESRVSQIHLRAVERMKQKMQAYIRI